MADPADTLTLVLLVALYLFLPLGLMATLFILSRKYRGMFDEIGFSRKEMGLLIVGSLAMLLVPSELPVVLYKNWFLAVNLGGAIIPTVLSIHLLHAKKIPAATWIPGIFAVSVLTFLITRVQPSAGIVAEFPFLFLPPLMGAALALILFSRSSAQAPAFAYASATLGSLIGADVYHLPQLFQGRSFVGSIGGAGVFDLVYIGGIVALAVALLFVSRNLRRLKAVLPHAEVAREKISQELHRAALALMYGQNQLSAQRSLGAVQARLNQLGKAFHFQGTYPEILARLTRDPQAPGMFAAIGQNANLSQLDFYRSRWTLMQAQTLLDKLRGAERVLYASLPRRISAFLLDALLMSAILGLAASALWASGSVTSPLLFSFAFLFWAFTIQVVYFTLFEYFWKGRTPGKWVLGIHVRQIGDTAPDFITAFTRNTLRLVDFVLFGYVVSLFLIGLSTRMQRIGDWIAETVVLRNRLEPPAPPTQPIYMVGHSSA
jgi:uncharacterized membrane protein/uncharacterized RDD family membrane protein YckC